MRRIAIVFLTLLAYSSAYPVDETPDLAVKAPESAPQVPEITVDGETAHDAIVVFEAKKDAAAPESDTEPTNTEQLLEVDAGVPASPELVREARQFIGGFGGFGGFRAPGYGGYGRYPGYGGYGGYPGYGGYGYGRYPGYGGYGGYGRFPYGYLG